MVPRTLLCILLVGSLASAQEDALDRAVQLAGDNADQIRRAIAQVPPKQLNSMRFLIENMPERDLKSLEADFLLGNVALAHQTWEESKWSVPEDIFLNNILPYANINESRDDFRQQFNDRFGPLVKSAKSPGEAAAILNNRIFKELGVKYSTKRRRADQGPFETMDSGLASCTGLSVLLIDACRSVGVPARFVGTPLWSDNSGNHSWVEIWDDGWHFTGAAEPTGTELDKAWFVGRSSKARRDEPRHAIYAVSYKKTPLQFPLVWDRSIDYVYAVNVTDRYANRAKALPPNYLHAMFKTYGISGDRCCTPFKVRDEQGQIVFSGNTKDESFDANDHTVVALPVGQTFEVVFSEGMTKTITTTPSATKSQLFSFAVEGQDLTEASPAVRQLEDFLRQEQHDWESIRGQEFATKGLTRLEATRAADLLIASRRNQLRKNRAAEMKEREIQFGEHRMPFFYKLFGDKPAGGRSLFISMHGGGGAPSRVNDRQWENQKRLYEPSEGVYVAPRAPTNTWDLWHQAHIMPMFDRLIENMVLFEDVNPNRVYLLGYSAGGDGVYQMAPRMADRLAAAAMMAGHPNDAAPDNLSNIGFAIYMGGKDGAYRRNEVAAKWGRQLNQLSAVYPGLYRHRATIYPNKGHWMDREDASALPWMLNFTRDPLPKRVVWRKDGYPQSRFYWLGADEDDWTVGQRVEAELVGQEITITSTSEQATPGQVFLSDAMLDLEREVTVRWPTGISKRKAKRTIATMHLSLTHRFDPASVFSAVVNAPKND